MKELVESHSCKVLITWQDVLSVLQAAPRSLLHTPVLIYDDTTQRSSGVMQMRVVDPANQEDLDNFDPTVELDSPVLVLDEN